MSEGTLYELRNCLSGAGGAPGQQHQALPQGKAPRPEVPRTLRLAADVAYKKSSFRPTSVAAEPICQVAFYRRFVTISQLIVRNEHQRGVPIKFVTREGDLNVDKVE